MIDRPLASDEQHRKADYMLGYGDGTQDRNDLITCRYRATAVTLAPADQAYWNGYLDGYWITPDWRILGKDFK